MTGVYQIYPKKRKNVFEGLSINLKLIILNVVLFFIFSILLYSNEAYINFIALQPANILQGNFLWTFLTSMFMHGGFMHLFVNMLSLFFVGSLIERILGKKRYLAFYLISGLVAGLIFVLAGLFDSQSLNAYAVGASGAIFGLIGLLVLLTPNLPVYLMFIPIPIKMKYAGPGMLIVLWMISIAGNIRIGNWAHFGGLIAGVAYGIYLRGKYKNKTDMISRHFS